MSVDIITSGEIGAVIRKRRKELCLSQEQLAEMVGVSYQQIQRYENGGSMLNVENVQRIAKALNVALPILFATTQSQTIAEPAISYTSSDEKLLIRHFRGLSTKSDKQLVINVIRKIARK